MAMTPIFKSFPHDILREVVLYAYQYTMESVYDEISFSLQVPAPPIPASHVCRSWRYALLSDPTTWTTLLIPKIKPSGILELLNRSGSAPLNVFLQIKDPRDTSHDETQDMLCALFQQIHRFKVLRLQINPPSSPLPPEYDHLQESIRSVLTYLQQPAPKLRTFSFWYENMIAGDHDVPKDVIMNAFFSGYVPNLQQLHYRLHFQGPKRLEFNDLSELYVTSLYDTNFGLLLELIASSPRLKVLHVLATFCLWDAEPNQEPPDRKVDLPYLQSLKLVVFGTTNLLYLLLKHVTFPSNVKWSIVASHRSNFKESPRLLQFLSEAHFTSLRFEFRADFITLIFEEEPSCNKLEFNYVDGSELRNLWHPLMHAIKSSCIVHMHFDCRYWTEDYMTAFLEILPSASSLESLTLEQSCRSEWPWLGCLMTLAPDLKKRAKYVASIIPADPILSETFIHSIASEDDDTAPTPTTTALPCPRLRKLNLELSYTLSDFPAMLLRICGDTRKEKGHPLKIFVQCPKIVGRVKRILRLKKNDRNIQVSIVPDDD